MTKEVPFVTVAGKPIPLQIRRNARARRISLRLVPGELAAVLIIPPRAKVADAISFARSRSDWLAAHLAALPPPILFRPNACVPLLGVEYRLTMAPARQRGVVVVGQEIRVPGHPEHFSRRVQDWLKVRARDEIVPRVHAMKAKLAVGHTPVRVRMGDPKSRWGSASRSGTLSFSWRLILAPPMVLDYVVAHECAHLSEMNHGPQFWSIVEELTEFRHLAQAWLKQQGPHLHRYG